MQAFRFDQIIELMLKIAFSFESLSYNYLMILLNEILMLLNNFIKWII